MFVKGFTDPQGTHFEAAVFQVLRSDFTANTSESFEYNIQDAAGFVSNSTANFSLNYRMAYWPSEAAKDAGAPPYILMDAATYNPDFASYDLNAEDYAGLTSEEAAELHCVTEIIKE